MPAILEVKGLVKRFGRRTVVDGVSYEVQPGEIVGLLGPNGAGKTTSFRMTTGQITPNDGRVLFNGAGSHRTSPCTSVPGSAWATSRRSRASSASSPSSKTCSRFSKRMPSLRSLGRTLTRHERCERTESVLHQFGLSHVRKNNAARCSGGEKRRLEIARCLACEPL